MHINLIFPTPVYNEIDEQDTCNRKVLKLACLEVAGQPQVKEREENIFQRVNTSYLMEDQLHTRPEFKPLVDFIALHSKNFVEALGFPGWSTEIVRMWTNVGKPGDFVYPHSHTGECFVSGVYYVSCDSRDGISILDPVERISPEASNPLNCSSYYYEGIEGRLLLFRAETLHTTFPQQGDERIIISFNLKLKEPE